MGKKKITKVTIQQQIGGVGIVGGMGGGFSTIVGGKGFGFASTGISAGTSIFSPHCGGCCGGGYSVTSFRGGISI